MRQDQPRSWEVWGLSLKLVSQPSGAGDVHGFQWLVLRTPWEVKPWWLMAGTVFTARSLSGPPCLEQSRCVLDA